MERARTLWRALWTGIAVLVLVLGCGGGGGGGDPGGGTLQAPSITSQPQSLAVADGQPAGFAVAAGGTAPLSYQWRRDGTPIAGATGATYTLAAASMVDTGARFSVVVGNAAGSELSDDATLTVNAVVPRIVTAPLSTGVLQGQAATFTVTAAGTAPLTYQWRRGGHPIAGANAATYTIAATVAGDDGASFSVVVGNLAGSVTSSAALLTVTPAAVAPTITQAPLNAAVAAGQTATFTVVATGTAPLAYQWRLNGNAIAGANAASYTTPPTTPADNGGAYAVVVSNGAGSTTSSAATLTVTAAGAPLSMALVAGPWAGDGYAGGRGAAVRFFNAMGIALDAAGNAYIADRGNNVIRRSTPAGDVTTFVGQRNVWGFANGPAATARFMDPTGVVFDSAGNLYVSEYLGRLIRKVTPAGVVSTFAGSTSVSGGVDGTGTAASFYAPEGIAIDAADNLYVADYMGHTIRRITPAGVVTTLAGLPGVSGRVDGTGSAARLSFPLHVAVDPAGNVWVGEATGPALRKVTPTGVVTTVSINVGNRPLNAQGMVFDASGVLWLSAGPGIVRVAPDLTVTTVSTPFGAAGLVRLADGNLMGTTRNNLNHITVAGGAVTSIAGAGPTQLATFADGTGEAARFWEPSGITAAPAGVAYVTDRRNCLIRRIDPGGVVSTWAGAPLNCGQTDGTASARFGAPEDLVADATGQLFVVDGHAVRRIAPDGTVSLLAGAYGASGSVDGTGTAARFSSPAGIAIDGAGNLYVGDTANHVVRKIAPGGVVTTLAGLAGTPGSANGTGTAARFRSPGRLAADAAGNVYVADGGGTVLRKITPAGVVTTLAGVSGASFRVDGTGAAAGFFILTGIAVDATGKLYVTDFNVLRSVSPAGTVTTLTTDLQAIKLGLDPTLQYGYGVALAPDRHLLVTDIGASSVFDVTLP